MNKTYYDAQAAVQMNEDVRSSKPWSAKLLLPGYPKTIDCPEQPASLQSKHPSVR